MLARIVRPFVRLDADRKAEADRRMAATVAHADQVRRSGGAW